MIRGAERLDSNVEGFSFRVETVQKSLSAASTVLRLVIDAFEAFRSALRARSFLVALRIFGQLS